jgi:glyoxylase-like metal-dependent hydrolase (beta-lactamase superfamily II)
MPKNVPPGIYPIRGPMALVHLLVEDGRAWLIDTGLFGEPWRLERLLRRLGLAPGAIEGILLTHGHLDHAGNLARMKAWTGAPVYAHPAEQPHIDGTYPYQGTARWCGRLEAMGRALLPYRTATIDVPLSDGDELPFWGGLRVVHLPGHSVGHCGFWSERHRLLFSADLFASYLGFVHLPPPILNSQPELIPGSLEKARRLDPRWMIPNHYDRLDGDLHRRRFDQLCGRVLGTAGSR